MKLFFAFLLFPLVLIGQSKTVEQIHTLLDNNQLEQAKTLALKYHKENPNNLEAIEVLGDVYGYQKDWDNAIENYEKLVEAKPNVANYHYKYGGALGMKAKSVSKFRALGLIGDVEDAFLTAANLDASHIDTRWALVHYYLEVPGIIGGSSKKAMKYAKELFAISPVDGYLAMGHVHEDEKEYGPAESNYKNAVRVGGSIKCYTHLIDLYEKRENYELAIKTIDEAYASLKDESLLTRKAKLESKRP
ncbi:tetratricopeptide repeat protein [Meridianimaribacter flavus]